MMRSLAARTTLAAFCLALSSGIVAACPPQSTELLFHSCWGAARLSVHLLPEDLPVPPVPSSGRRLIVTGAYTARDTRDGGLPKPVGLFVRNGELVNPNLARMDGVLVVDPGIGAPALHHRTKVPLGGRDYDLTRLMERRDFAAAASAAGLSVLQSHLLIVDGKVDVRPQDEAPVFVRRMLFVSADGFGIYQPEGAMTLLSAAEKLAGELAPTMALNLDMGSYDYCRVSVSGEENACGILGPDSTEKLSNLLMLVIE